jgi:ABC-type nitrate/sulfonate/bicarbonate transport system ATPase subunit
MADGERTVWDSPSKPTIAAAQAVIAQHSGAVAKLELKSLTHVFNRHAHDELLAIEDISLKLPVNRFVTIIGPSGCGKSTVFNIIAGLTKPTTGSVLLDGHDVTGMVGFVGYMLQKDLLLPWRTVLDNVILGMELQNVSKPAARKRALPYLGRYGLSGFERRYPAVLSGGMRQRAALLRTLLYDSEIILLDEPFGALDAQTRAHMQQWLLQIWADFRKTVVFVTHDVDEAVYLSDEIFVMSARPGRIKERIEVPLSRPRSPAIIHEGVFRDIKRRCLDLLGHYAIVNDTAAADGRRPDGVQPPAY